MPNVFAYFLIIFFILINYPSFAENTEDKIAENTEDKIKYVKHYILTIKGIAERTKLTINFMKRKMAEYDELKKEIERNYVDSSQNKKK